MTDKEKILAKIELLLNETNYEPFTDEIFGRIQTLKELKSYIDSLQEEPVSEELVSASKEWLAPQLDKSYAAYGETKQMELTHFDGYAMLDAIEFGAKWGKNQAMAEIQAQSMALAHGCPEELVNEELEEAAYKYVMDNFGNPKEPLYKFDQRCFKAGAKWKEQQMMSKAIDANCFGFQGSALFSFRLPADKYLVGSEVKVIVIKQA